MNTKNNKIPNINLLQSIILNCSTFQSENSKNKYIKYETLIENRQQHLFNLFKCVLPENDTKHRFGDIFVHIDLKKHTNFFRRSSAGKS